MSVRKESIAGGFLSYSFNPKMKARKQIQKKRANRRGKHFRNWESPRPGQPPLIVGSEDWGSCRTEQLPRISCMSARKSETFREKQCPSGEDGIPPKGKRKLQRKGCGGGIDSTGTQTHRTHKVSFEGPHLLRVLVLKQHLRQALRALCDCRDVESGWTRVRGVWLPRQSLPLQPRVNGQCYDAAASGWLNPGRCLCHVSWSEHVWRRRRRRRRTPNSLPGRRSSE